MIASQVARFADRIMSVGETSAAETVEMIVSLNGIRDPKKYERFLSVCAVILITIHGDQNRVEHAVSLLRDCRERMKQTDVKRLAESFQGAELRGKVRSAYVDQVSGLFNGG